MSNRSAATPCDSMPLQTIPAPQRRGHLRGRARCWSVQTGWAASAAWRPLAVLAAAWGLAAAAPPNPAKVCAALYGGLRRRRAPRRSRAALPACPPQPPVRRLLPLASVPPVGADEPRRATTRRTRWRVLRRGPSVTGGTVLPHLFKSPVPLKIPCRLGAPLHLGASCAQPSGADAPIRKVVQDFCKIPAREIEKAARKGGFSLYLII